MLGKERYEQVVRSIKALSRWEAKHVKEFLQMHEFELSDEDVKYLCGKINEGMSLNDALTMAKIVSGKS
jgi:hypothetical protein